MAADYSKSKRKPVGKMVLFGICSAIIYGAVLSYQGLITAYFTRGALVCCPSDCRGLCHILHTRSFYRLFLVCFGHRSKRKGCGETEAGG